MSLLINICRSYVKLLLGRGVLRSYSQFGEDAILQRLLRGKNGIYVDVGAYHPILYSNTYAFYRRGWKGVAIDPNPFSEKLFRFMRPSDAFIRRAVSAPGESEYYEYNDPAYNAIGMPAAKRKGLYLIRTSLIHTEPLSVLLQDLPRIDLLNIDVEGMDAEVLKTYDWRIFPAVIAIEGTLGDASTNFLTEKGYELAGLAGLTMIFKHRRTPPVTE